MENKFFQLEIIINVFVVSFLLHLNTYAMDLRPLQMFISFNAGIDLRRQNLTSLDVRFSRLKTIPALIT